MYITSLERTTAMLECIAMKQRNYEKVDLARLCKEFKVGKFPKALIPNLIYATSKDIRKVVDNIRKYRHDKNAETRKPKIVQPTLFSGKTIADYTDKDLVNELRCRGYEVKATKTIIEEI